MCRLTASVCDEVSRALSLLPPRVLRGRLRQVRCAVCPRERGRARRAALRSFVLHGAAEGDAGTTPVGAPRRCDAVG